MAGDVVEGQLVESHDKLSRRIPGRDIANAKETTSTAAATAQPKPEKKPRVKTWTPRARTGCSTCRARRIKCDELVPVCRKCLLADKACDMSIAIPFRRGGKEGRKQQPGGRFSMAAHPAGPSNPPMLVHSPGQHPSTIEYDWMQGCHHWERLNHLHHYERRITVQPSEKETSWLHLAPDRLKPVLIMSALGNLLAQETKTAPYHADAAKQRLANGMEKYQHYYGVVVRTISQDLEDSKLFTTNRVAGQLINLMVSEIIRKSPALLLHLRGFATIVASRGGIREVLGKGDLSSWAVSYVMVAITAIISTSPATTDLPSEFDPSDDDIYLLYACELHECFPCPTQLYRCIVEINRLRVQDASGDYDNKLMGAATQSVLASIQNFSPEHWPERPELRTPEIRLLIAQIYKSATQLYLRLALRKHTSSPITASQRAKMAKRITDFVERLVAICGYHSSQAWPLTVAGAGLGGDASSRRFVVDRHLLAISGMHSSSRGIFITLQCLRRFWASGKTGWEDCFTEWHLCFG
ncbi:hypothetical protein PWT90_04368 [Aphanocladium album]|nr:hypothetical protein PWT90_04368 [Aphanocladium album]